MTLKDAIKYVEELKINNKTARIRPIGNNNYEIEEVIIQKEPEYSLGFCVNNCGAKTCDHDKYIESADPIRNS